MCPYLGFSVHAREPTKSPMPQSLHPCRNVYITENEKEIDSASYIGDPLGRLYRETPSLQRLWSTGYTKEVIESTWRRHRERIQPRLLYIDLPTACDQANGCSAAFEDPMHFAFGTLQQLLPGECHRRDPSAFSNF